LLASLVCYSSAQIGQQWCRELPRPEYHELPRMLENEPWFEIYQAAPGVFAIYEPHQAEETISYLITGNTKALLFDTGMGIGDLSRLIKQLTRLPFTVLNSHTHNDHVGGNWQFDMALGMDTEFTRKNAEGSRDDAQAELGDGMICGELPKGFSRDNYGTRPWKISRFIHDGERIDLGGRILEVIATPGHTPDSIVLLDRANGLLFTGDTYYPAPIWLFRPETNFDGYERSIQKLADLSPRLKLVLGAHNVPLAEPAVLPELLAAFRKVRAGKIAAEPDNGEKRLFRVGKFSFWLSASSIPETKH
jgi:glyoxylase-like metal-dependent hydrolase (beta-lactamase superfamily II)